MKETTNNYYLERIAALKLYIQQNLFKHLTLEELARVSCFSEYHFHRLFSIYVGESVASYIKRLRIEYAAQQLAYTADSIQIITHKTLFKTQSAFSKAFRQYYNASPSEYRKGKQHELSSTLASYSLPQIKDLAKDIEYCSVEKIRVLSLIRQGPCLTAGFKAWEDLEEYACSRNLITSHTRRFGTTLDPRDITDDDKHRYVAMITVDSSVEPEGEFFIQTLGGGPYAVFPHNGSYEYLYLTCTSIFCKWLPTSNEKLRDSIMFDEYICRDLSKPVEELQTKIYVPIQ